MRCLVIESDNDILKIILHNSCSVFPSKFRPKSLQTGGVCIILIRNNETMYKFYSYCAEKLKCIDLIECRNI